MLRSKLKSPPRLWGKVAVCIIAIDMLLFRVGILWHVTPNFGLGLGAENWHFLYRAAREFESGPTAPPAVFAVGSSVVVMGVDETQVNTRIHQHGVPGEIVRLVKDG